MRSLRNSLTTRWRKGVPLVSTPLRCRATLNALSNWTSRFQRRSILTGFCTPSSYKSFVVTHNQIGSTDTITELFAKLKAAEVDIKKDNHVLMVNKPPTFKKGKGAKNPFKKGGSKRVAPAEKKLKSG